ncbi:hypothetical protein TPA0906_13790 [Streptomyces olivaceus]|nr:hypothetical protein TPA0906_13790 [Streptomyces olivaceus]
MEFSERLGRHRWKNEKSSSWLFGYRRPHLRHERKPERFLAFTAIAATFMCYRRVTK